MLRDHSTQKPLTALQSENPRFIDEPVVGLKDVVAPLDAEFEMRLQIVSQEAVSQGFERKHLPHWLREVRKMRGRVLYAGSQL
jgi:hypothetical protein